MRGGSGPFPGGARLPLPLPASFSDSWPGGWQPRRGTQEWVPRCPPHLHAHRPAAVHRPQLRGPPSRAGGTVFPQMPGLGGFPGSPGIVRGAGWKGRAPGRDVPCGWNPRPTNSPGASALHPETIPLTHWPVGAHMHASTQHMQIRPRLELSSRPPSPAELGPTHQLGASGKSRDFLVPQFPHLKNGDNLSRSPTFSPPQAHSRQAGYRGKVEAGFCWVHHPWGIGDP